MIGIYALAVASVIAREGRRQRSTEEVTRLYLVTTLEGIHEDMEGLRSVVETRVEAATRVDYQ